MKALQESKKEKDDLQQRCVMLFNYLAISLFLLFRRHQTDLFTVRKHQKIEISIHRQKEPVYMLA